MHHVITSGGCPLQRAFKSCPPGRGPLVLRQSRPTHDLNNPNIGDLVQLVSERQQRIAPLPNFLTPYGAIEIESTRLVDKYNGRGFAYHRDEVHSYRS